MSGKALAAPGRVIRVTTSGLDDMPKQRLFAIAVGDDQQALAHFKRAYPEPDEIAEIVGDLSEESLQDLGLTKPGLLVPL